MHIGQRNCIIIIISYVGQQVLQPNYRPTGKTLALDETTLLTTANITAVPIGIQRHSGFRNTYTI